MPRALNIPAAAPSADCICVGLVDFGANRPSEGEVTIEVRAAGVNPSDATDGSSCSRPWQIGWAGLRRRADVTGDQRYQVHLFALTSVVRGCGDPSI